MRFPFYRKRSRTGGSSSLSNPADFLLQLLGGRKSASGIQVTATTALYCSAVYACVKVLAETVASLPLNVYQNLSGGGKEKVRKHPLYPILHRSPNSEMTSFELRETLMGHLGLWGNAYSEIEWNNAGRVKGLWPLRPDKMQIKRIAGELIYFYLLPSGQTVSLTAENVLHIRGLGSNGIVGHSPIYLAREAIGLALATEEYGSRFFANDANPGGILEHPSKLSDPAIKRLRESWEKRHQGLEQKHRLAILEEGLQWKQVGIPPEDAQFLETRKFQRGEIASFYRMPPHKIGDLEHATFSNIEHQGIEFVVDTIRPWLVRWEQRINIQLFTLAERKEYFAEFVVDGLLRGDTKSRYDGYATGRQWGWLSADDIRELENQNPLPNGQGKIYMVPLNMVPAGSIGKKPGEEKKEAKELRSLRSATARKRIGKAYKRLFEDAVLRIVRREEADIMRAAKKYLPRRSIELLEQYIEEFYEGHPEYVKKQIMPVLLSYGQAIATEAADEISVSGEMTPELEKFIGEYEVAFNKRWVGSSRGQMRKIMREAVEKKEDIIEALQKRFDEWEEKRPGKVSLAETVQMNGAISKAVWVFAGKKFITWVANKDACDFCAGLSGKTIAVEKTFIQKGVEYQPVGSDKKLTTYVNVGHPPAHGGCQCFIVAA